MREILVFIHRWAGLAMAVFLVIVGLTGSLLAFYEELEHWTNPERYAGRPPEVWLKAGELAARLEEAEPRLRVRSIHLHYYDGTVNATVVPRTDPQSGRPFQLSYQRLALDPSNGAVLARIRGSFKGDGFGHLWSFVYGLHYALALGDVGQWMLGVTALVWTLDCFVAFYLTLPGRRQARPGLAASLEEGGGKSGWRRWAPAWRVRWRAGGVKLNFDLHRAGGLWLWPMLLLFAWSSVGMDLLDTVYTWTMQAVSDYRPAWTEMQALPRPLEQPRLSWREAEEAAEKLMAEQARRQGFTVLREVALRFDGEFGVYTYQVESDLEIDQRPRLFTTQLSFDADTGRLKHVWLPSGQHGGNTVSNWLYALHMGNVFGLPYRIFVCVLGLAVAMLSVTGVVIWAKKRGARRLRLARLSLPPRV